MKDSTKKAVDKAIDDYRGDMVDAATDVAIEAHISGDIAAHAAMGIPVGRMEVQKEALLFGRKYKKLLKETGGTIIRGKRIDWLASHTEDTRKAVYETIRSGLIEGKPVADIGGKLGVPGTVAHDLEKLIIRDAKYKYVRIARTETAAIQNQGTLNRFKKNKITHVEVIDGTDFDEACAEANGQTWTVEYASSHELEHPNCTRSFSPVVPDDWIAPDEAEPVKKPKITKKTAPPKPGTLKPATPKAEISEIADDLADRQIKTSNFGKLAHNVELDDPAHWDELLNRGWPKDPETFKKSYIRMGDKVHLDKDGNVFAISRYEIKGKTLRIKEIEINPALKGPEYGKTMLRDIADDGLANGAIEINVSAWDDIAKELYNSAGLKQGTMKSSFSADATMMKELAGKTDLVITSRTKETSRITRYLKKLEKSDPEKLENYKNAVRAYTTERYKIINPALRDGIDSDKVIARMTAKEHATIKREIDTVSEYLKDAPKFKGEVYRGVGFDDKSQFDDFINSFQGNTHTSSPQFTSSSILRSDAEYFEGVSDYSATLKIKSNDGSYIGGLSEFREETEVLFDHSTKFKIKNIVKVSDRHYDIELEDVIK